MLRPLYLKTLIEAGIDEAGRGPLFGRVYAAAVVLHPELNYDENMIKDSKRISKKKLPSCEEYVKDVALDWSVAFSTEERIDEINILHASLRSYVTNYFGVVDLYASSRDARACFNLYTNRSTSVVAFNLRNFLLYALRTQKNIIDSNATAAAVAVRARGTGSMGQQSK